MQLGSRKEAVAKFLKSGGYILAIGLDEQEVRLFLPFNVTMKTAEHINAYFEPAGVKSLLAGIGSADVHNRDPREIELISGGAAVIGNGVLAVAEDANVVFCQLAPWQFDYEKLYNLKRTFRRIGFTVTRLLANMGTGGAMPLISHFSTPAVEVVGASLIKNGDFSMDSDDDGLADHWQFDSSSDQGICAREMVPAGAYAQRITCPGFKENERGHVMLAQYEIPMEKGQWYRISFRAKSEGLRGNRVSMSITDTSKWESLIEYQRFTPGEQWKQFTFKAESSGTVSSKTRLQLWYDKVGTVWFSDVRVETCKPPTQGRWLAGLYLDEPIEMDDPYRFFCW